MSDSLTQDQPIVKRGMIPPALEKRNRAIYLANKDGKSTHVLSREYGVSAPRIAQIIKREQRRQNDQ